MTTGTVVPQQWAYYSYGHTTTIYGYRWVCRHMVLGFCYITIHTYEHMYESSSAIHTINWIS